MTDRDWQRVHDSAARGKCEERLLYFLSTAAASRGRFTKMSYVLSGIAILICGGIGAAVAWMIVSSIGWHGVVGALVATALGMVLATALFALGAIIARTLGFLKSR